MKNNKNPIQVLIGIAEQALLLTIAIATIGAAVIEIVRILSVMTVNLSDLFLLFIYAEVLGMVGVFYKENRIPVTLPLIIAITALTRMIVIQTKGLDSVNIIFEASGILLLAIAAYIMSKKEELSLKKMMKKKQIEDSLEDKS
ncbi:phosphate-starvation-inducible PsiE family protein [Porticoccaceae bacterium]|nr:phosphate-starvation-inducible PsiE family protein [Porticoccaceae bacterium]MDA9014878.1 phosphate-starvation-inducible PsiE family protein [Porticoccaceae bacterium]